MQLYALNVTLAHSVASPRRGGGASGITCPPTSDRTTREIDADPRRFSCLGKMEGRFTGLVHTFYMHRRYGGRSLVLRLRKKGVLKVVKEVALVGPQWSCGAFWDLSVLAMALPSMTFFFLNVNFEPLPKNTGPNLVSFQILTGCRLTEVLHFLLPPPQHQNSGDAYYRHIHNITYGQTECPR